MLPSAPEKVFDDDGLSKQLAHLFGHDPPDYVGGAAGREWHDHGNGAGRIGLRPCNTRHRRQRGSTRCQMKELSAGKFHDVPLNELVMEFRTSSQI
jgi:hypothetical protein